MGWPQIGPGGFFPYESRPCRHVGQNGFGFWDCLCFFVFFDPKFLDSQVPRSPNFWISRSPNYQISRFPDFQTPPNKFSDPNLTPLLTHPGIKYVARALAATYRWVDNLSSLSSWGPIYFLWQTNIFCFAANMGPMFPRQNVLFSFQNVPFTNVWENWCSTFRKVEDLPRDIMSSERRHWMVFGHLTKFHLVPCLRWHNVSWHQVFRFPEGWASIFPEIWYVFN